MTKKRMKKKKKMEERIDWKQVKVDMAELIRTTPSWRLPTVRSVFYYFGDTKGTIPLTEYGYKKIVECAVELRKGGQIPFGYFKVKRGESSYIGGHSAEPSALIADTIDEIVDLPEDYELPHWFAQDVHLEVWIEKIGLLPSFEEFLRHLDVKIRAAEGYASWEFVHSACKDIRRYSKERCTEKVVVLYFGDLDPSGLDIGRHVKSAIEFFDIDLEFKRIALFPEQLKQYDLPEWPEKMASIDKMKRDPRRQWYFEKYGQVACELDSFVSKAPDELRELVCKEVERYINEEQVEEAERVEKEIKDKLQKVIEPELELLEDLKKRLTQPFKVGGE